MADQEGRLSKLRCRTFQNLGVADILEWLIVIAVAVALRGGDVAIVPVVVGGCRRQFFGFAVFLLWRFFVGRLFVFAGSTHVIASDRNGSGSCPTIRLYIRDPNLTFFEMIY